MKCPNCGKEITDDSLFCEHCGAKVVVKKPTNHKKLWIVLGSVLGVAVVAVVLVLTLGGSGKEEEYYFDLGLPSGTRWKLDNEKGFYTYDEAMDKFAGHLPTKDQIEELLSYCYWEWGSDGYTTGYFVYGPKREGTLLPADGIKRLKDNNIYDAGNAGVYWSASSCADCGNDITKYVLSFSKDESPSIVTTDDLWKKAFSVRKVDRSFSFDSSEPVQAQTGASQIDNSYVDLGLPSGTKWKDKNEETSLTYNEAVAEYGNSLPNEDQVAELLLQCRWTLSDGGYLVTGPNGNSIFMPFNFGYGDGIEYGCYWSSTPYYGNGMVIWFDRTDGAKVSSADADMIGTTSRLVK